MTKRPAILKKILISGLFFFSLSFSFERLPIPFPTEIGNEKRLQQKKVLCTDTIAEYRSVNEVISTVQSEQQTTDQNELEESDNLLILSYNENKNKNIVELIIENTQQRVHCATPIKKLRSILTVQSGRQGKKSRLSKRKRVHWDPADEKLHSINSRNKIKRDERKVKKLVTIEQQNGIIRKKGKYIQRLHYVLGIGIAVGSIAFILHFFGLTKNWGTNLKILSRQMSRGCNFFSKNC